MPQNLYEALWIFVIYAFVGWCMEVTFAAVDRGEFVNRGFLNGPYCPIYGCGVVIVVAALYPIQGNLLLLFAGSVLLTTLLEFLTGLILEKIFHNKWWDYSELPFNICGYVCLKFSLMWGLACMLVVKVVHPVIYNGIGKIPYKVGIGLLAVLLVIFAADCCVTVATILRFNKRIRMLDKMAENIHKLSDELGEDIFEKVSKVMEKSEELQQERDELLQKLNEKKEEYNRLLDEKHPGVKRLLKAFPNMKSERYNTMLQKYREHINELINKNKKRKE